MARKNVYFFKFFLAFLIASNGCTAQTAPSAAPLSPEVIHRMQTEIRSRYSVPSQIDISVSEPKAQEIPGFDAVVVTFTGGGRNTTHDFLISKDRKTLAHLDKIDISQDLMAKIDVKGRPVRGNEQAKVTIINFDDFQCPFCSRMHSTLFPGLMKQYAGRVKFIYKDYPLVEIHHWAMHAAVDANCLADQSGDAYWEFADFVHDKQKEIAGHSPEEALDNLDKAAAAQGEAHHLDAQKLKACFSKNDETAVRSSMADGDKLGVDSTPTMFINGEKISGAVPEAEMRAIIDRALNDAGEKVEKTTPPGAKR